MEDTNNNSILCTLEAIVKFSAVAITLGFIISISYDYAYFKALKLSFSDIPSTINDHIRNSLICVPFSVVTIAIWLFVKYVDDMAEESNKRTIASNNKVVVLSKKGLSYLTSASNKAIIIIGTIGYIIFGNNISFAIVILAITFAYYSYMFGNVVRLYELHKYGRPAIVVIIWLPLLIVSVFANGYTTSEKDQKIKTVVYKIYQKDNGSVINCSSVRYFEKFIFIMMPQTKSYLFIPQSEVRKIEQIASKDDGYKGIIDYFGYELKK